MVARLPDRGLDIAYDTFGDRNGAPVILVMGLGQQMVAWGEGLCVDLSARDLFVVRFDNRDCGLTSRLDHLGPPRVLAHARAWARGQPVGAPWCTAVITD